MSISDAEIDAIRSTAIECSRLVGARIREVVTGEKRIAVTLKSKLDPVTEIDIWSEREIRRIVGAKHPKHTVIGEEEISARPDIGKDDLQAQINHGTCWVVDPLDGTTNFSAGLPQVCVSIGVLHEGRRIVGVVYDPVRDELFTAVAGEGAYLNSKRIFAGKNEQLVDSVVATGLPYDRAERWPTYARLFEALVSNCRAVRILGSAALDQCWVACGRLDGFCEYNLKPWDAAAGSLIVEEAGGAATNFTRRFDSQFNIVCDSFSFAGVGIAMKLHQIAADCGTA
jgi:myo-inositol-1(or 4)-monophosphatase